ncbi:MAG TPA: MFS transporter [Chitinophagaceae bacterium]|nr:MFS transporter [Chitinophagaceae bacterium]
MNGSVKLGLKENLTQFILLVIVNGFVGGMIGIERTILPRLAEQEFHITNTLFILSFIVIFGVSKAITNYFTGALADKWGRKNLLVIGWVLALPLPLILMYADQWKWILMSNILLGIHQGLTWSSTVVMKIDLVGEKQRGFAMGLNEFAGYISVAGVAFVTGYIAEHYGVRPYPFLLGLVIAIIGLLLSWIFVKDTRHHVKAESTSSGVPRLKKVFSDTTWRNPQLGSITQAGLINNLNDGMAWGLFPILLAARGFALTEIGTITAIYPAVWGLGQLITGKMGDRYCKKDLLFSGMIMQGIVLLFFPFARELWQFIGLSALLGWGTALVYPTFLSGIAEYTHPQDRAKSLGIFRLWRDLGYAIGAVLTGLIAEWVNINLSITVVAILTIISSIIIYIRMKCPAPGAKTPVPSSPLAI